MSDDIKQLELFEEDKHEKDRAKLDQLFKDVKSYRKGYVFQKKLEFYAKFPYLGVYNAELVSQQRPGARFVLTAEKWEKKFHRKIKTNARPLIILVPFYPVDFLFDITDTKPIDNTRKVEDNFVIERITQQFIAECRHPLGYYKEKLGINLEKNGIYLDHRYLAGSELFAEIREDRSETLFVQAYKDVEIPHHSHFILSINSQANDAQALALIFHELGHLFCRHFNCAWWESRQCTKDQKEFEAETVSYLVCERLGIHAHSVEYLANYLDKNGLIPEISAEIVFQAVDMIQDIASKYMSVVDCLLYKHDEAFKQKVDIERERRKMEKEKAAQVSI